VSLPIFGEQDVILILVLGPAWFAASAVMVVVLAATLYGWNRPSRARWASLASAALVAISATIEISTLRQPAELMVVNEIRVIPVGSMVSTWMVFGATTALLSAISARRRRTSVAKSRKPYLAARLRAQESHALMLRQGMSPSDCAKYLAREHDAAVSASLRVLADRRLAAQLDRARPRIGRLKLAKTRVVNAITLLDEEGVDEVISVLTQSPVAQADRSAAEAIVEEGDADALTSRAESVDDECIRFDQTGLRGRRARIRVDRATDHLGREVNLPADVKDIMIVNDEVSPFMTVLVCPVNDPTRRAYIAYDQLELTGDP
jgi:hypothetical protein